MTRRLQLLLDEERMERLEARAAADGRSVAALVREAVDLAYPRTAGGRTEALRRVLAAEPMSVDDDPERFKRSYRDEMSGV